MLIFSGSRDFGLRFLLTRISSGYTENVCAVLGGVEFSNRNTHP